MRTTTMGYGFRRILRALATRLRFSGLREQVILAWARWRSRLGRVELSVNGNRMLVAVDDPGIGKELILTGVHESRTTDIVRREVEPGMTVLDIGANIGYYALLESALVGEAGTVFALEPVPENFELLNMNIRINGRSNIRSFRLAASDVPGQARFKLTDASNWGTMLDVEEGASAYMQEKMLARVRGEMLVDCVVIDDFLSSQDIRSVNFVRMDIEGYEIRVLRGMTRMLRDMPGPLKLLLEVHNKHFEKPEEALGPVFRDLVAIGFRPKVLIAKSDYYENVRPEEFVDLLCSYSSICCHVLLER